LLVGAGVPLVDEEYCFSEPRLGHGERKAKCLLELRDRPDTLLPQGASNPHPHGQIWSLSYVPQEPATVLANFDEYAEKSADGKSCLLLDYAKVEKEKGVRMCVAFCLPVLAFEIHS
jgi:hypothetical protein